MSISAINPATTGASVAALPPVKIGEQAGGPSFGQTIQRLLADTNAQQLQADHAVQQLVTGKSDSIHETMLALTKADLNLRVFLEVQNKVVEAYQEVMRMQL